MLCAGLVCGGMTVALAAEPFSRQVTPEQFRAAGLEKLSPEELARLDALVQGYRVAPSGRETPAPRPVAKAPAPAAAADTEAAAARVAAAEARARQAEQDASAAKEAARAAKAEQKKAEEGFCEGRKPFGYYEGEEAILGRLKAIRAEGLGFDRIAAKLNEEGVPTRTGKPWHGVVVNRILTGKKRA